MAKSSRSKSERRSKAILYARVFKPAEEARTARLSAKLHAIPSNPQYLTNTRMEDVSTTGVTTGASAAAASTGAASYKSKTQSLFAPKKGKKSKISKREIRTAKIYEEFSAFGLSMKEVRF